MAGMVGRRVGEMHVLLAAGDPADRDFAPEPLTPFHRRALFQSVRAGTAESLSLLAQQRDTLGERDGGLADELLAAREGVDAVLRCLRETPIDGQRIRVHGDLHLGQLLDTGSDVVIIDFEGEPARPLGERRLKRPALTDLAGMLRSFHYVAHSPRLERQLHDGQAGASDPLAAWSTFWYRWVSAACIRAYREATAGARFLPSTDAGWSALLEALLLAKAGYELRYELGSRPDWVSIPIIGLLELLRGTASPRPPLG
jgi:trehalose synthase-fused probable maltokinase